MIVQSIQKFIDLYKKFKKGLIWCNKNYVNLTENDRQGFAHLTEKMDAAWAGLHPKEKTVALNLTKGIDYEIAVH